MTNLKKFFGIAVLMVLGIVNIYLYRNIHLYQKTRSIGNYDEKIQLLEKANRMFPYNPKVFSELGRTYFELASLDFQNIEQRDTNFKKSVQIRKKKVLVQTRGFSAEILPHSLFF